MAHQPMSEPDRSMPESSAERTPVTCVGDVPGVEAAPGLESDVAELAAKFAARGGMERPRRGLGSGQGRGRGQERMGGIAQSAAAWRERGHEPGRGSGA